MAGPIPDVTFIREIDLCTVPALNFTKYLKESVKGWI